MLRFVKLGKENQTGRIIRGDEDTAAEGIERALKLPPNTVQRINTNKVIGDGK